MIDRRSTIGQALRQRQRGFIINPFALGGGGGGGGDPLFASVVSLLHFDGADGSTSFTDVKGKVWTAQDSAQLDTAQKLFGSASLLLAYTGAFGDQDRITTPDHNDFDLTNGNFCFEIAGRLATLPASGQVYTLASKWDTTSAGQLSWFWYIYNNAGTYQIYFSYSTTGSNQFNLFVNWPGARAGSFIRFALDRNSADLRFLDDGTQVGTTQNIGTDTIASTTSRVAIGAQENFSGPQYLFNGHFDEWRLTRASRRTANYTPDAAAFPDF